MKLFLIIPFIFLFGTLEAQKLSKEEKALQKEWEKRKKNTKPEELKALFNEKEKLEAQRKLSETAIQESIDILSQKNAEITALRAQIAELEKIKEKARQNVVEISPEDAKGTFYKVQIFSCDNNSDEETARKYTLGRFNKLTEAQKFLKSLEKMQIKNAKIVTYKDGKIVR
jgi:hypothetical protein